MQRSHTSAFFWYVGKWITKKFIPAKVITYRLHNIVVGYNKGVKNMKNYYKTSILILSLILMFTLGFSVSAEGDIVTDSDW